MEVMVQHWACGEDSLYMNSHIYVAVPLKEDAHEEQPLAHEECAHEGHAHEDKPLTHEERAHEEHAHKGHAHEDKPLTHEEQPFAPKECAHKEQPFAHEEQPFAHEEQPFTHEEQPFTHEEQPFAHKCTYEEQPFAHKEQTLACEEQHLTYKECAHMVHETHNFTTENNAGWQYEYLPSNSFTVHKVNYNEKYGIPSNVYWNLIPDIYILIVSLFIAILLYTTLWIAHYNSVHHNFMQRQTETQMTLVGGGKTKKAHWIYKDLQKYQINNTIFSEGTTFTFHSHQSNSSLLPDYIDNGCKALLIAAIPITQLHSITKPQLIEICRQHNIPVKKRDPMEIIEGHLRRHRPCPTCDSHYTIFVENDCKLKTGAERMKTLRFN